MDKKITNTYQTIPKSALKNLNRNFESNLVIDDNKIDELMSEFITGELETIYSIINSGQILNFKNQSNQTLIHAILRNESPNINEENKLDIIKKLVIEKNVSLHTMSNYNQNPLHFACQNGYKKIIEYMIKNNCDQTLIDNYGYTPIHYLIDKFVSECKNNEFYSELNIKKKLSNSSESIKINKIIKNQSLLLMIELFANDDVYNEDIGSNGYKLINAIKKFINNKVQLSLPEIYKLIDEKNKIIDGIFTDFNIPIETKHERAKNVALSIDNDVLKLFNLDTEFSNVEWTDFLNKQNYRIENKKNEIKKNFLEKIEHIKKMINENISINLKFFYNKIYSPIILFVLGMTLFIKFTNGVDDPSYVPTLFSTNDSSGNIVILGKIDFKIVSDLMTQIKDLRDNFVKNINENKVFLNGTDNIGNLDQINYYISFFENNHQHHFDLYEHLLYFKHSLNNNNTVYSFIPNKLSDKTSYENLITQANINSSDYYTENLFFDYDQSFKYSPIRIVMLYIDNIIDLIQYKLDDLINHDINKFTESVVKFMIFDLKLITEFIIKIINNYVILEKYIKDIDVNEIKQTNNIFKLIFDEMINKYVKHRDDMIIKKSIPDINNAYEYLKTIDGFSFFIKNILIDDDCFDYLDSREYIEQFDKLYDFTKEVLDQIIDLTKILNEYCSWDQLEKYNEFFNANKKSVNFSNTIFNDYLFKIELPPTYKTYKDNFFKIKDEIGNIYNYGNNYSDSEGTLKIDEFIANPNYLTDFYQRSWNYVNTENFNIFYLDNLTTLNEPYLKVENNSNVYDFTLDNFNYNLSQDEKFSRGYDLLKYVIKNSKNFKSMGEKIERTQLVDQNILFKYSNWNPNKKSVGTNPDSLVNWNIKKDLSFDSIDEIEPYIITKNLNELINMLVYEIYNKISKDDISRIFFTKSKIILKNRTTSNDVEKEIGIDFDNWGLDQKTILNLKKSLDQIQMIPEEKEKYLYDNIKSYVKMIIYDEIYIWIFKIIKEIKYLIDNPTMTLSKPIDFEKNLKLNDKKFQKYYQNEKLKEVVENLKNSTLEYVEILNIENLHSNNNVKKIFESQCVDINKINKLMDLDLNYRVLDSNGNSILIRLINQLNIYGIELLLKSKPILSTYKNFNGDTPLEYLKKKIKTIQLYYTNDNLNYRMEKYNTALENEIKSNKEFEGIELNNSLNLITNSIKNSIFLLNEILWLKNYLYPMGWNMSDKNKLKEILNIGSEKLLINTFDKNDESNYIENKKIKNKEKINSYLDSLKNDLLELENKLNEYQMEIGDKDNLFLESHTDLLNKKINNIDSEIKDKKRMIEQYEFIKNKIMHENYNKFKNIVGNISSFENKLLDINTLSINWDEYNILIDSFDNEYLQIIQILNSKCDKFSFISNYLLKIYLFDNFDDKIKFDLINKYFKLIFVKEYNEYMDLERYDDTEYNYINNSLIQILKINVVELIRNELINTLGYYLLQINTKKSNFNQIMEILKTNNVLKKSSSMYLYLNLINKLGLANPDKINLQINIDEQKNLILNILSKLIEKKFDEEEKKQLEKIIFFNNFVCENIGYYCMDELIKILDDGKKMSILYQIYDLINKIN